MQSRRSLLGKLGGLSVGIGTLAVARTGRASCAATPAQMAGPFYPEPGQSWEDGDLTTRRGSSQVATGEPIIIEGQILGGGDCAPLPEIMVEVWQADDLGKYKHTGDDRNVELDPHFQYWGRIYTNRDAKYRIKTIMPGKYPARTPHLHFRFVGPDGEELITQLYFARYAKENRRDGIYRGLLNQGSADRVTTQLDEQLSTRNGSDQDRLPTGRFNVVMPGAGLLEKNRATPFVR